MKFEPDLKLCEIQQRQLLSLWKENNYMSRLIETTERTICAPESFNVYRNFGKLKYCKTLNADKKLKSSISNLLDEYFKNEEKVYLLFSGKSSQIDKFALWDYSYPIFVIKYENVRHWIDLAIDESSYMLMVSSLNFKIVIDISNLAEEDHSNTRTIYLKNSDFIS